MRSKLSDLGRALRVYTAWIRLARVCDSTVEEDSTAPLFEAESRLYAWLAEQPDWVKAWLEEEFPSHQVPR